MPLRYTSRILEHLAHASYRPAKPEDIARAMQVEPEDQPVFETAVRRLASERRIDLAADGQLRLPHFPEEITGKFRLTARGFGFVIPDQPYIDGDLYVPPGETGGAISRDRVRAKVIRRGGKQRAAHGHSPFVGRVIEVIERGQDNFTGVLVKERGGWFVVPDGRALFDPVLVRDPHVKNARPGDKVVIELLHYPDQAYHAEGVITQVLGEAGRPDVETQAVIVAHGLRTEFPDETIEQARAVSRAFDRESSGPWKRREDLTDLFTFTIDPPDAKDFDDAISLEHDRSKKQWTLGVHIADVAHFIEQNSPLDVEAKARGNSAYLPRLVIPMLPEVLSNGVCSLQEGVTRFTKSVFITFDHRGKVLAQRVCSSAIRSRKRLTYLEAQALIDGDMDAAREHTRAEPDYPDELFDRLRQCQQLAKALEKRRQRDGMIVLNLPEVELVFDEEGHVIDAVPEDDAYTHKVIEMFMVEANEALARLFDELHIPILRRVHPDPVHGDMAELRQYALAARQRVPDEPTRFDLQRLLDATRGTPAVRAIHFAVLRTLAKASYSPALIGHFALASEHYAHFTSPIRRYPDLTLHRALAAYLDATDNGRKPPRGAKQRKDLAQRLASDPRVLDDGVLIELGRHCSETEVEATAAERDLREFLVLQFLHEHHLGDEFPGVVTGVIGRGVFVSIEQFLVEGLINLRDLPQSDGRTEKWTVNDAMGRVTAQRSGRTLAVGDIVTVQIVKVDLAARHLDLYIGDVPDRPAPPPGAERRREPREKARPAAKARRGAGRAGDGKTKKRPSRRRR